MKKNKLKLFTGMLALSTNLAFSGCGNTQLEETNNMEKNITDEVEIESSIEESQDISSTENFDEFFKERVIFESIVNNSESIYTDEFKNVDKILVDYDSASDLYEITAKSGEGQYELTLPSFNYDLINFLIHQTNCQILSINYDKDEQLISSLTPCDSIKRILLNDCQIKSIAGVSEFNNLEELLINNCPNITDLSPIENLKNLNRVAINGTRISDISVLAGLPNLKSLNLKCNEITNPEVLEALENIDVLDLEFNRISDISQLKGLVEKGVMTEEQATSIVKSCETNRLSFTSPNYQEETSAVYISYIDSKDAYFVELRNENEENVAFALTDEPFDFYNLTEDIPNCKGIMLSNLPIDMNHFSIADPQKYEEMIIDHCYVDSILFVNDFKNLIYLSIENCPNLVDSFAWHKMHSLDCLKTLIVEGTNIKNFDGIKNFSALEEIKLTNNDINDFSFLTEISNLKVAYIGMDYYPTDLTPLETLRQNGVYVVDITGYAPPLKEDLIEESEEQTEDSTKTYGLNLGN